MTVAFGPFVLDIDARQLVRAGDPIPLSPKAFDLLKLLLERRPAAVAKADIHQHLWPGTFVSDVSVAVLVTEIRNALGESARHWRFIRTVHRFGYAFAGAAVDVPRGLGNAAPTCWLEWDRGGKRAVLSAGDNLVGRDAAAGIRIAAVGVSRRHALIVVRGPQVILRDLGSKNGTFVNDTRVTAPVALVDGEALSFGPVVVSFHHRAHELSTETMR